MTKQALPAPAMPYDPHPSLTMYRSVMAGMKEKTGRTLEEWIDYVNAKGPASENDRREWLKQRHKLGTNYAWWIAERSVGKGDDGSAEAYLAQAEQFVQTMYAGPKSHLYPLYLALLDEARALGPDIKVCPCQTMVPIYRRHVIANLKPTTRSRLDLGLSLRGIQTPPRLIDTGGEAKKDRITRRIEITSLADIDDEVRRWLRTAYQQDN